MPAYRDSKQQKPDYRGAPPRGDSRGPQRPPAVTAPTPCNVTTNLFRYTGKALELHQYAVTFVPEVAEKSMFPLFQQMVASNGFKTPYAYDGAAILVLANKIGDTALKATTKRGDIECRIEYKHTHKSSGKSGEDFTSTPGMQQCMEIISHHYQRVLYYLEKKKMFYPKARPFDLGMGLEVLPGLVSTIKLNREGYYLNLDAVFGVFYKEQSVLDLLGEVSRSIGRGNPLRDEMGASFYDEFERLIKNLRMTTTHREKNGAFKVSGLHMKGAGSVEFEADGRKMTVAEYFAKTYKPLQYPHLPLAVVKKGGMTMYLPLEVLKISPCQRYARKLDENMTSQMIKIAAKRPRERFELINEKAKELAALKNDTLAQFGMAFDNKMLNCKGVMLPPPQVVFAADKHVHVNNGSWNLIGAKALQGVEIDDWKIFSFRSHDTIREDTIRCFVEFADKYGVRFKTRPQSAVVRSPKEFFDAKKARFNIVILPDRSAQRYEEVKRIAETYHGVYTQCILASNIAKLTNPSFASNLLLKINAKLGGKNWSIDPPKSARTEIPSMLQDKPTILFGIDVCHPGPGDIDSPSIASIVATMDYQFITYRTAIEQQEPRREIVGTLRENVKAMLKAHYAATKAKPQRLLIFRDGVGDSMFSAVYACEVQAIQDACTDLDSNYKPEINFIIAQKRHSIRFATDGNNLVPGTVVDDVGTPGVFDFFLVSHHALQGTARPVRYILFRNDSNFDKMGIYQTVYGLCHLYARATKSVGVVPPIYYADLAAARGKCYLEKNKEGALVMRASDNEMKKRLYYV